MSPLGAPAWGPGSLSGPWALAESIAARDLNNLYRTSCYFADGERYRAFCALYAVMRVVDDRIDAIPSRSALSAAERAREHGAVAAWEEAVAARLAGGGPAPGPALVATFERAGELLDTFTAASLRFPVPPALWANFFAAMHRDVDRPRFATYEEFLEYTEGASVAPTTIYLALVTAEEGRASGEGPAAGAERAGAAPRGVTAPSGRERGARAPYRIPAGFDLVACGRELGLFAYLAHILRDLGHDLATGEEGLLYFAADDMARHGVSEASLFADLGRKRAGAALRALAADLGARARAALARGRTLAVPLAGRLAADRAFILDLIMTLYEAILDRIAACDHDPFDPRHRLTPEDKQKIAQTVAARLALAAG